MKSVEEIKTLFRDAGIGTDPAGDKVVLTDACRAGGLTSKKRAAPAGPSIWRFVMNGRTAALAAAFIVVAVLGVYYFNGTAVEAVQFSEITRAMEQVPWMRMTESGFDGDKTLSSETWLGFESKVHVFREADGYVRFECLRDHKISEYVPSSNTIVIAYMEEATAELTSPMRWLESLHERLRQQGAKAVVRRGEYEGHVAHIQEASLSERGEQMTLTLYIDPQTKRLYAGKWVRADATGNVTVDIDLHFDYPPTGPQSIYDLGVPQDAKIVNTPPATDPQSVLEEYRRVLGETSPEYRVLERYVRTRDEATRGYIAVIAHNTAVDIADAVNQLDVDYKSDRKHRWERHSVFDEGQRFKDPQDMWTISEQRLGETFESMLGWSRGQYAEHAKTGMSIRLYDGLYGRSIRRDPGKGWGKPFNYYQPAGEFAAQEDLGDLAWPHMDARARIIEDEYASEHKLICFERLQQGYVRDGAVNLPSRFLWYLDPAQDYLCRRKVTEWRRDADWQEDKDWLEGVDPSKVPHGSNRIEEITEAFQAPNGHWYPVTIMVGSADKGASQGPPKVCHIKRIYLDWDPEFPEGIFDIDKLPGR